MSIKRASQRGLSLIELIMFIVIISIAAVAILQAMGIAARNSADPVQRKQALAIAEGLLAEVQNAQMTYCDPSDSAKAAIATGPADCSSGLVEDVGQEAASSVGRPYDNVNDYVSQYDTEQSAFDVGGTLADASGTALSVSGYRATLSISPTSFGGLATNATPAGAEVLHIIVTVYYGDGQSLVLDGFRTRYAPQVAP